MIIVTGNGTLIVVPVAIGPEAEAAVIGWPVVLLDIRWLVASGNTAPAPVPIIVGIVEKGIPFVPVVLFDMGYGGWLVASGNIAPVPVPIIVGMVPVEKGIGPVPVVHV